MFGVNKMNNSMYKCTDTDTTRPNVEDFLTQTDFSDMLAKYNITSDSTKDNGYDSDDPFEDLIRPTSKNITATPSTHFSIFETNKYDSSKYDSHRTKTNKKAVQLEHNKQPIAVLKPRTPLKSYVIKTSTPRLLSEPSELGHVSSGSNFESSIISTNLINLQCGISDDNVGILLSCKNRDGKLDEHASVNTSKNGSGFTADHMNSILESTPNTPLSSFICQNSSTPKTYKTTPRPISSLKKYSLMKAAAVARQDIKNMLKAVELNKRSLKNDRPTNKADCNLSPYPFHNGGTPILNSNQTLLETIFRGVVAYVEVRSGKEYRCNGTIAELESHGAKTEKNFTKKVTHCFFHGGKMSTYRKAIDWKVPLVSTLWIEACKEVGHLVPIDGFEPYGLDKYKENLPLYRLKTKTRRPLTGSKILAKPWKAQDATNKTTGITANKALGSINKTEELFDELDKVAGIFKKAPNQIEGILTSSIPQQRNQKSFKTSNHVFETNNENRATCTKKRNKKLVFCEEEGNKENNKPSAGGSSVLNDTNDEISASYDPDDIIVNTKRQAVSVSYSTPSRVQPSRKCKKLLFSCSKPQDPKENDEAINFDGAKIDDLADHLDSKTQFTEGSTCGPTRTKKRKLSFQALELDSGESAAEDLSPLFTYTQSQSKRFKTAELQNNKTAIAASPVWSDANSEDSLTRAARRESSALFVKKEKKIGPLCSIPTVVCTTGEKSPRKRSRRSDESPDSINLERKRKSSKRTENDADEKSPRKRPRRSDESPDSINLERKRKSSERTENEAEGSPPSWCSGLLSDAEQPSCASCSTGTGPGLLPWLRLPNPTLLDTPKPNVSDLPMSTGQSS